MPLFLVLKKHLTDLLIASDLGSFGLKFLQQLYSILILLILTLSIQYYLLFKIKKSTITKGTNCGL